MAQAQKKMERIAIKAFRKKNLTMRLHPTYFAGWDLR
jgi:hypothetical protein